MTGESMKPSSERNAYWRALQASNLKDVIDEERKLSANQGQSAYYRVQRPHLL